MFTVDSLMIEQPKLWGEVRQMPMDKLKTLIDLMNGETFEPAGRETASKQVDKEDALISSLRLDYLIPIESAKTGKGNKVLHLMTKSGLHDLLSNRSTQKKLLKQKLDKERKDRAEGNIKRSIEQHGYEWTLKRVKAVNRKLHAKQKKPELENCSHCDYEQLASDLFYGGCIKCGGFNDN
ncbi:hypothetical protein [Vibrio sp. M260118]|uniref:hypothetical protein n=1 Tax=Vibrio sp. M260118 TaxID=3020896 RepID=UPI002F40CC6D